MELSKSHTTNIRWRSVALPTEHGGWAFITEPILLGLLLAPSLGGAALSAATLGAFLLRQPLKIYIKDVRAGRRVPRTHTARQFTLIYAMLTAAFSLTTLLFISSLAALLPLLFALPLFVVQLTYDIGNRSRSIVAEMAGALATGALVSCIVLMQDWSLVPALALWLGLAVKTLTAILYVRARLSLERGKSSGATLAITAHAAACALLLLAYHLELLPRTAPLAMGILTVRAAFGLSVRRSARQAKVIGMREVAYGLGFIFLIAMGYRVG